MSFKILRNIFIILSISAISYGIGYRFGQKNVNFTSLGLGQPFNSYQIPTGSNTNHQIDLSLFWDVWDRLSVNFIKKENLDPQKMLYGAISGMVSSLDDPYTVFLTPNQNKDTKEELGGSFTGIGAQLGLKDKRIVVIAPLSGTPAEKAGIKPGDWILEIEGKTTENLTLPEAVSKIRGPKGTKVNLTILHEKEEKPVKVQIVRDTIMVKSVEWEMLNEKLKTNPPTGGEKFNNIAYLKLSRFGDETDKEWETTISNIKNQRSKIRGIILDLRNNPGGYLTGSIFVASEFLPLGKTVVIQENANGTKQTYTVDRQGSLLDVPLVVLVNKGSASASEIVAGALKDYKRAKIIGEKTFGKGSIQESQELPDGSGLHITTAKWLLPLGTWINGSGIEPDIKVELNEKEPEKDTQLIRAGEEIQKLF